MATNPYELLNQKEIIQILVGDNSFGYIPCDDGSTDYRGMPNGVTISLPHLDRKRNLRLVDAIRLSNAL